MLHAFEDASPFSRGVFLSVPDLLRVARTIADLDGSDAVRLPHVAEAVSFRIAAIKET